MHSVTQDNDNLETLMAKIGQRARKAARVLGNASTEQKNKALLASADALRQRAAAILAANALDMADAEAKGVKGSFLDRLKLDAARLESIAQAVADIAALKDPVGRVLAEWTQPNGLRFERVATPLGVIGVIFESRPNVTERFRALPHLVPECGCHARGPSRRRSPRRRDPACTNA